MDRQEMAERMADALAEAGVPPIKVHKAVAAVMATLASTAIEDSIAGMVDKRMNALQSNVDLVVEKKLTGIVEKQFNHKVMRELVGIEARRQTEKLYAFMFNNGEK